MKMKKVFSLVARNAVARDEESGLARHVLCEESELKSRIHGDIGVERVIELKISIIIFRKGLNSADVNIK